MAGGEFHLLFFITNSDLMTGVIVNVFRYISSLVLASVALPISEKTLASQFDIDFDDVFPEIIPEVVQNRFNRKKTGLHSTNGEDKPTEKTYFFKRYQLEGKEIIDRAQLDNIVQLYLNRKLTQTELTELVDKLTLQYIGQGYINSGIVLSPVKTPADTLNLRVVSGIISEIEVYNAAGRLKG